MSTSVIRTGLKLFCCYSQGNEGIGSAGALLRDNANYSFSPIGHQPAEAEPPGPSAVGDVTEPDNFMDRLGSLASRSGNRPGIAVLRQQNTPKNNSLGR
jgi:hypothetical protein